MNTKIKFYLVKTSYFLGIIGSIASIIAIIIDPRFQIPSLIVLASLFLIFILIITTKYLFKRSKEIKDLQLRVGILEKTQRVPFFKKWPLIYSHLWKSGDVIPDNPIELSNLELKVEIKDGNKLRDAKVSFHFVGKFTNECWNLNIVIGGDEMVNFEHLNFTTTDNLRKRKLKTRIADKGRDSTVKDIIISFDSIKNKDDYFDLYLEWSWPRMMFYKSDYISLPNIFSQKTDYLRLVFEKKDEMDLKIVEAYRYDVADDKPIFLRSVYASTENKNLFIFEQVNPIKNTDYLLYYES